MIAPAEVFHPERRSKCRGCGAPIVFVKHSRTGNTMPLELLGAEPAAPGVDGRPRFALMPHHARCPKASEFRKRQARRRQQPGLFDEIERKP